MADGRLVRPSDIDRPADQASHLVRPRDAVDDVRIRALRDWLFAKAEPGGEAGAG